MTYLRKLKIFLAVAVLGLSASSCLDDQPIYDADSTHSVIEFFTKDSYASTEGQIVARYSVALQATPEEELSVTLSYSGPDAAPEDIQVVIASDTAAITAYNNSVIQDARDKAIELGDDPDDIDISELSLYDKLPESLYSIPNTTITIPKGQHQASFPVKLKVNQFDFSANYGLALTIKSASIGVISANYSSIIYGVLPKNSLDGIYTLPKLDLPAETPQFKDHNLSNATADYPRTIHLVTQTLNSVAYFDPGLNGGIYGYSFTNGTGSYYGNWAPVFFFEGNNITKVENYYGQGNNGSKRSGKLNPDGPNTISTDENGNTVIEVWYYMLQGAGNPDTDPVRTEFREKFVFSKARP